MTIDPDFFFAQKAMLVAPAGHGKTHFIAESVASLSGRQLILTHTHAGVASLKAKLSKMAVPRERYEVETISSFCLGLMGAFYTGVDVPAPDDKDNYFPFIEDKAREFISEPLISQIITRTYSGAFVDEYQDCSKRQHELVKRLAELIPTRLLGDPLQGIMPVKQGGIVDLNCSQEMAGFCENTRSLDEPKRWLNTNPGLGETIKQIRSKLENRKDIDLSDFSTIELVVLNKDGLYSMLARRAIDPLLKEQKILFIHPLSFNTSPRIRFVQQFSNRLRLIESIDDEQFYSCAKKLDETTSENYLSTLLEIGEVQENRSELGKWIDGVKVKRRRVLTNSETVAHENLHSETQSYVNEPCIKSLKNILQTVFSLPGLKCYRPEILRSLYKAMDEAIEKKLTIYEGMVNYRNRIRRLGRSLSGRLIGTTLLTKGLEFDTVVVLNAHQFDCPKNFYVAISRATRRLVILSESATLRPYAN